MPEIPISDQRVAEIFSELWVKSRKPEYLTGITPPPHQQADIFIWERLQQLEARIAELESDTLNINKPVRSNS